jgi:putative heme transporter
MADPTQAERTTTPRVQDADGVLQRLGRRAWALVGVAVVVVALALLLQQVSVVLVAAALALFPAALLWPASAWLQHRRVPGAVASLLLVLGLLGGIALLGWVLWPRFAEQAPALWESLQEAFADLQAFVVGLGLPVDLPAASDVGQNALDGIGGADAIGQGLGAVMGVVHLVTGTLILLVTLFFLLKDGPAIWRGVADLVPSRVRSDVDLVGAQVWWTIGSYFRGQLLVALFDAVFIGLGLWLLGVPLAFPLAVLVFFGGLFPIVGAFVSGLVAVLVALADSGLTTAVLVLLLVLVVQQVESNVLEPLILSKVIALHPLVIVLAVSGGALAFGVLGAFLAVPVWAAGARVVDHLRGRRPPAGPASEVPERAAALEDGAADDAEDRDTDGAGGDGRSAARTLDLRRPPGTGPEQGRGTLADGSHDVRSARRTDGAGSPRRR